MVLKEDPLLHYKWVSERLEILSREKSRTGDIARAYRDYMGCGQLLRQPGYLNLLDVLTCFHPESLPDMYTQGARAFVECVAGEAMADTLGRVIERLPRYPYLPSVYRRSFRSGAMGENMRQFVRLLSCVYLPAKYDILLRISMCKGKHRKQPVLRAKNDRSAGSRLQTDSDRRADAGRTAGPALLTGAALPEDVRAQVDFVWENLIALSVDEGDPVVMESIRAVCLDETGKGPDQTLLRGVLKCGCREMHDLLLNRFLRSPSADERQHVLQMADHGCVGALLLVMKTLLDEDLLRYEDVRRAVTIWLGLGSCVSDPAALERVVRLALAAVADAEIRRNAVYGGKVAAEILTGLWAVSLADAEAVFPVLDDLLAKGNKRQRLAALSFAAQLDHKERQAALAYPLLRDPEADPDILCLAMANFDLSYMTSLATREGLQGVSRSVEVIRPPGVRQDYFAALAALLPRVPVEGYRMSDEDFSGSLCRESVFANLFLLAAWDFDIGKTERLIDLMREGDNETRRRFIDLFLSVPRTAKERNFLFSCLKSKSMPVRLLAAERIEEMAGGQMIGDAGFSDEEKRAVMDLLALKSEDLRAVGQSILLRQSSQAACDCARELCVQSAENKRLAGFHMLAHLRDLGTLSHEAIDRVMADVLAAVPEKKRGVKEEEAIREVRCTLVAPDSAVMGLGLFDPGYRPLLMPVLMGDVPPAASDDPAGDAGKRLRDLAAALCEKIEAHKDFAFWQVNYDLSETEVLLGNLTYLVRPHTTALKEGRYTLDDFVLPEVWRSWLSDNQVTPSEVLALIWVYRVQLNAGARRLPWCTEALEYALPQGAVRFCSGMFQDGNYGSLAAAIMEKCVYEFAPEDIFVAARDMLLNLMRRIPVDLWRKPVCVSTGSDETRGGNERETACLPDVWEIEFLLGLMEEYVVDDGGFLAYAAICIQLGQLRHMSCVRLSVTDMAKSVVAGLVEPDLLYQFLCEGGLREAQAVIRQMGDQTEDQASFLLRQVTEALAARVIRLELKRGDNETAVSRLAMDISYHEGADILVGILVALGDVPLGRGAVYNAGVQVTKSAVLLSLLRASSPGERDTKGRLAKALAVSGGIAQQRLLEAALYVPAWTEVIVDYLAWPGLWDGVVFLRAHTEAQALSGGMEIQRDDRLMLFSAQEIGDGAFEVRWFYQVLEALGEERFDRLLDAAKEVIGAGAYSRVRLFADAALNKIPLEVLYRDIAEKRRGDKLLCLGLTPLGKEGSEALTENKGGQDVMAEISARCMFIEEFFRQSQSFGAKRRAKEKKACVLTLKTLAVNAGFPDAAAFIREIESGTCFGGEDLPVKSSLCYNRSRHG